MADTPTLAVVNPAAAAATVNTPLKSGLLCTELWLKVAVMGMLAGLLEDAPNLIARLQAIPGLPAWTGPAFLMLAAVAAYAAPKMAIAYGEGRVAQKLAKTPPASPDAAAKVLS